MDNDKKLLVDTLNEMLAIYRSYEESAAGRMADLAEKVLKDVGAWTEFLEEET